MDRAARRGSGNAWIGRRDRGARRESAMCRQRLARVLLFGCLLTVLGGGAPLLRPPAAHAVGQLFHAQAAQAAPALVWPALPLSSRSHDGAKGDTCSAVA